MRGCQVGSAEGKLETSPRESVERALHKKEEIQTGASWCRAVAGPRTAGSGRVQVLGVECRCGDWGEDAGRRVQVQGWLFHMKSMT